MRPKLYFLLSMLLCWMTMVGEANTPPPPRISCNGVTDGWVYTANTNQCAFAPPTGSGGGISSLNGLTATTQTFASPGTSGLLPNWVSSGSTHTLNIPMAATSSVTAGLLSKTQYDVFNAKESVISFTTPLLRSVNTVSCQVATGSVPGCLAAADFTTFNAKESALSFTTPVLRSGNTISCQTATGSVPGCLAAADFVTFNGKEAALTFSSPILRSVNAISCQTATGSVPGCLAAADFTVFNAKAPTDSPAFTTQVTFGNYHMEPSEVDDGNSSTADTINFSTGSARKSTLTGNVTYTFTNPTTGGAYVMKVLTGAGSFTPTWPATVIWTDDGGAPTTTAASKVILVNFYYDGTNYWGSFSGPYTP